MNTLPDSARIATPEAHARFGPKLIGALPGPRASTILSEDSRLLSPSYTRSYPLVVHAAVGAGSKTWMATSSSTSPPASRWLRPGIAILR